MAYQTTAGDTWDKISYKVYGEEKFATNLMNIFFQPERK